MAVNWGTVAGVIGTGVAVIALTVSLTNEAAKLTAAFIKKHSKDYQNDAGLTPLLASA